MRGYIVLLSFLYLSCSETKFVSNDAVYTYRLG